MSFIDKAAKVVGIANDLAALAKLAPAALQAVDSWVNGDGPEPTVEVAPLPDLTRMRLAQARLERLANS